ncbi:type IV secretory system conjugative DNA transfer family protein [Bradyrhizobium sp. 40]|uniref:type IV secretory system conjugative DNA transfer family protein n=1 Tax=Bradyrhizobium sp. 40 TaxID=2782674 RepID=UPI00200037B9|nr:type IV secretory system conjugative DNA transfer family protein [Bradyrhizobium sp. 40]UPJ44957.1 type IV secretory system conjugative DNA transfer family protein [Bradyrhizobium sp. 40]
MPRFTIGLPFNLAGIFVAFAMTIFALCFLFEAYVMIAAGPAAMFHGSPPAFINLLPGWLSYPLIVAVTVLSLIAGWPLGDDFKAWFSRRTWWYRRRKQEQEFGKGGSAAYATIVEEWRYRYRPGDMLLGVSRQELSWPIGWRDDRGFLTIAGTRSGKGRSLIIPNLLVYPGSALVIDPKGTNAAVTAARRGKGGGRVTEFMGQDVHILDPFGCLPQFTASRFNPLDALDRNARDYVEQVGMLVDALVVPGPSGETPHWDETTRNILKGAIIFVMQRKERPTFLDFRELLTAPPKEFEAMLEEMQEAGEQTRSASAPLLNAGPNERGSFMTTILRNTDWIASPALKDTLSGSDFDINDLKRKRMTIYVVLPGNYLELHARFMRLVVNLAINAMWSQKTTKPRFPVLFLLDEFFSLGRQRQIEISAGLMSGLGMTLWPIVQNLSQLEELYPKNWETFFANAGAVQAFGVNDRTTGGYLSGRLGHAVWKEQVGTHEQRIVSTFREPAELEREAARETGRVLVFRNGDLPMLIRRLNYDQYFPRHWYNPDPDFADGNGRPAGKPPLQAGMPDKAMPPPVLNADDAAAIAREREALPPSDAAVNEQALPPAPEEEPQIFAALPYEPPPPDEDGELDPFAQLDALIGLKKVKDRVHQLIAQAKFNAARIRGGMPPIATSQHLVFTGNPGTGKTTVARIVGAIYEQLELLEKGHVVEVDRSGLVGQYLGQTGPKVTAAFDQAMDGVLFIDEAYSLAARRSDGAADVFGQDAINTIVKLMEDRRDRVAVIAAGYTEEMNNFLDANPGLHSRFGTVIEFEDYNPEDLTRIFAQFCTANEMEAAPETLDKVHLLMTRLWAGKGRTFGNARETRNVFEACLANVATRVSSLDDPSDDELRTILPDDVPDITVLRGTNGNGNGGSLLEEGKEVLSPAPKRAVPRKAPKRRKGRGPEDTNDIPR